MTVTVPLHFWRIFFISVGLTLLQMVLFLVADGGKYDGFIQWDSGWYLDVAVNGYKATLPLSSMFESKTNIAFFPAFPLFVRSLLPLLPFKSFYAIGIAGQISCVGFWMYLFLLFRRFRVSISAGILAALAMIVQPGSFYLVTGYSEAFFCFSLLGFLYWTLKAFERKQRIYFPALMAVLHGGLLSSTRYVGVFLVIFPLFLQIVSERKAILKKQSFPALGLALSLLSLWGISGYFVFCQLKFGQWNLYFDASRLGWNRYFEPFLLFSPSFYLNVFFSGPLSEPVGRILAVVTIILSIKLIRLALRDHGSPRHETLALALLSFYFLGETLVGSQGVYSGIRHLIPINAVMLPLIALQIDRAIEKKPSAGIPIQYLISAMILLVLQAVFVSRYAVGHWVS